jgi:succinoglycan biosynthesis transport protein ExoP
MNNEDDRSGLRTALSGAWRHRARIAIFAVLCSVAAFLASAAETPQYSALAQVLISRQNLAATVSGSADPSLNQQPDRVAQTQAEIARVPVVAQRTVSAAHVNEGWKTFVRNAEVSPKPDSDVLNFVVRDASAGRAVRLATEYATQFVRYRRELDTAAFQAALRGLDDRLRSLSAAGKQSSRLYGDLVAKQQQLRTLASLQTGNATVLRRATAARRVKPRPVRSVILGGLLGVIVGALLATFAESRDTTIRTTDVLARLTGQSPLAYLSPPRRRRGRELTNDLERGEPEQYRMLAANLTFVAGKLQAKAVLVTSALPGEGKSTTVAHVATALAAGGLRVLVLDADSRAPAVHRWFGDPPCPGLFDLVSSKNGRGHDHASTASALTTVAHEIELVDWDEGGTPGRMIGGLTVVPAGTRPVDPLVTLGSRGLAEVVSGARASYDLILIDSLPLLPVSDTLPLLRQVDGVLLVAMLGRLRRPELAAATSSFSRAGVPLLGVAVTGQASPQADTYAYPYATNGDGNRQSDPPPPVTSRARTAEETWW